MMLCSQSQNVRHCSVKCIHGYKIHAETFGNFDFTKQDQKGNSFKYVHPKLIWNQ